MVAVMDAVIPAVKKNSKLNLTRGGTQVPPFIKKFEFYFTASITASITATILAYIPAVITGRGDGH